MISESNIHANKMVMSETRKILNNKLQCEFKKLYHIPYEET